MTIYIWLLIQEMIVRCIDSLCSSVSMAHFDYLLGIGSLELIFEVAGIIKIYSQKGNGKK